MSLRGLLRFPDCSWVGLAGCWCAGLLWLVAGLQTALASAGEYLIDVWGAERGLPNSSVTSMVQTPDGYLWIGTYNGLARFDGVAFTQFDPDNTPALQHARIRRLFLDAGGTLWINTYDGSLTTLRDGVFALAWQGDGFLDSAATLISSRSNQVLFALYSGPLIRRPLGVVGSNGWQVLTPPGSGTGALTVEDGQGEVWYRAKDQRLWRLRGNTFEMLPAVSDGLRGKQINCLVPDQAGRVWAGTDQEIALWNGHQFQHMTPTNGEPALDVRLLYPATDGGLWSVANGRVRKSLGRRWVVEAEALAGALAGVSSRLGAQEDRQGGLWLYHYGKGLFHVQRDGRGGAVTAADGFPSERVDSLFLDHEGNAWAGLDRSGLARLRAKRFQVVSVMDGTTPRVAVSVSEDASGAVWIGTLGGGLGCWRDGALTNIAVPGGTGDGFVFSVCPDNQNRLWLSAGEEDLFVREGEEIKRAPAAVHAVKAILADREGRVWLGTKSGLACWTNNRVLHYGPEAGIARTDIRALAQDRTGALWAGAGDGSLYQLSNGVFQAFRPSDAAPRQPIWSVLPDASGAVWVGTFRGGLLRFKDRRFVRYTVQDGLPSNLICQLLDDGAGSLWVGTHQGIFRVAKAALNAFAAGEAKSVPCVTYGRYDGLPALECSGSYQPSCWRGKDGRLWFATIKGAVSVQPADIKLNRLPPPVVLAGVLVDGQLQEPARRAGAAAAELVVPPGRRQLEIRFAGLSYSAPDMVQYRYQLAGLDPDWVEAGGRRDAQYSYLRPGDYHFRVTACNNDGVWNPTGAALRIHVLPHFYETWWFLTMLGLACLGGVVGAVRSVATRRLRHVLDRLEQQRAVERDRARIAKDIHDDLGAGLTQITLLSELARRDPPQEVEGHLGQISETARELTRAMDEIVWAVNPQNDTLDSLVSYVCKFAQDYLRVAGIRCRLDAPAQLPPLSLVAEVRHNLFLAVKETLNNIVKHAGATEVWVRLSTQPTSLTLEIEDNGHGFGSGVAAPASDLRASAGHGLGNLNQRLAAIGGHCTVRSDPGSGTRVEFVVHFTPPESPLLATTGPAPASAS